MYRTSKFAKNEYHSQHFILLSFREQKRLSRKKSLYDILLPSHYSMTRNINFRQHYFATSKPDIDTVQQSGDDTSQPPCLIDWPMGAGLVTCENIIVGLPITLLSSGLSEDLNNI